MCQVLWEPSVENPATPHANAVAHLNPEPQQFRDNWRVNLCMHAPSSQLMDGEFKVTLGCR